MVSVVAEAGEDARGPKLGCALQLSPRLIHGSPGVVR